MSMNVRVLGLLAATVAAFATTACSDDGGTGGIRTSQYPDLEAAPDPLLFEVVPIGQSTQRILTLKNVGGGALQVTRVDFSNSLDTREFTKSHPEVPFIVDADERVEIRVDYSPRDPGTDRGELIIESNDPRDGTTEVRILSALSRSDLLVEPVELAFGRIPTGQTKALSTRITNLGTIEVPITDVKLADDSSADFTITAGADARPSLGQGDRLEVEVTYTPRGIDRDLGTLVVSTGDAQRPQILVPLSGEEPSPEIATSPEAIIFGAIDQGAEAEQPLVILNEGSATLEITSLAFGAAPPGINDQFALEDAPELPLALEPGDEHVLLVRYHPQADGIHDTSLVMRSNDVDEPIYTVPIRARVRRPCIQVAPESINLGRVALGVDSQRARLRVLNCGELPLRLEDVTLAGDDGFQWAATGANPIGLELAPLDFNEIEVWYHNADLADGQPADATLTVRNNTPDTPVVEVPLGVLGGGAPSCDLLLLPNRVDFGLVSRGSIRTRSLDVLNRGTGHCDVTAQRIDALIPIPGFVPPFIITRPLANQRVAPGQRTPIEVTYRPALFAADSALLTVAFHDPFRNEDRQVQAQLNGVSGESNIEVIPEQLDFGQVTARECASQTERVTVYNTGIVDLCISDVQLEGPNCDEFFIVDRPVANQDGCILVTRRTPAEVHLTYEPADLGDDECFLVFESDASDQPQLRVPLFGEGIRDRRQVDEFVQSSGQTVDILFVVDNSGSMGEEQDNLGANFAQFIAGAQQFQNDFQIGIVTTDLDNPNQSGKLQGNPRILRRGPDVEARFRDSVDVGVNGAGSEYGLEAAKKALSNPLAFDTGTPCRADNECVAPDSCVEGFCGGHNRGFVREAAALVLVFLSDEEDQSPSQLDFYVDFFKNIKGFRNEAQFKANVIVGARNGQAEACESPNGVADAGRRYVEVAQRTNGAVYSICDANFGASLREIGQSAFGLPVQFFLTRPAIGATVRVSVDGQPVNDGWAFDQDSNSVIFEQDRVPRAGSRIRVEYEAQCFPRH